MFQNPYFTAETGLKGHHRVNISISESDWSYIKGLRLGGGTITTTISILFKCLTDELINRGLNDSSDSKLFEQLVSGCRIELPTLGGASSGPPLDGGNPRKARRPSSQGHD